LFLNAYVDGQLSGTLQAQPPFNPSFKTGLSWTNFVAFSGDAHWSWLDLFYGAQSSIAIGSGSTPVQNSDTALANEIRFDSTAFSSGNSVTWNSTTGNIVYTIKDSFPVETGSVSYTEAGIRIAPTSGNQLNGVAAGSNRLINRVVFPGAVSLSAGESLILTVAVTIPSLASSAGKTITIAAQNGVNITGVLKCVATGASMAGGTVTSAGALTRDLTHPLLFNSGEEPVALLSTKTSFDTLGTNPTWGQTNQVTGVWGSYTNGNRFRDVGYQWGSGVPASNTNFRSILFRKVDTAGANGGYQLLLDNQMTKASTATLALNLRFQI
jgi:hypothetical protein